VERRRTNCLGAALRVPRHLPDNGLARPGAVTVLGTPIHLDRIKIPTFVTGALN
jgi:poly(3-hydroxyalkanoate) synthetase